jgi:hypothetical protein
LAQHTKTVTGYHGLYRDNDAIVMGCGAFFNAASGGISSVECHVRRNRPSIPRQNGGLQWPRRHG